MYPKKRGAFWYIAGSLHLMPHDFCLPNIRVITMSYQKYKVFGSKTKKMAVFCQVQRIKHSMFWLELSFKTLEE